MRDWKRVYGCFVWKVTGNLKPTYEGLKDSFTFHDVEWEKVFKAYLWGIESVLHKHEIGNLIRFKAYLWGIESSTSSVSFCIFSVDLKPTYEGLKVFTFWFWRLSLLAFKAYLWGIERWIDKVTSISLDGFKAYLWGIERPCLISTPIGIPI